MSDHAARPCSEDATTMSSAQAHQSCWLSRWINCSSKQGPAVNNSSLICYKEEHVDSRGCMMHTGLKMEDGLLYGKRICNSDARIQDLAKKPGDFGEKFSYFPFPTLSLGKNEEIESIVGTQNDLIFRHKPMSVLANELQLQHGSPENKNFQSFFLKNQSQNVPGSFRNVETMGICTTVDSVENSPHHIVFTKEACVSMSKENQSIEEPSLAQQGNSASCSRGVKIQPLCTSNDSEEKETTSNPYVHKAITNEASVETNGVKVELSLAQKEEKLGGSVRLYSNVFSNYGGVKIQSLSASTGSEEKETMGNSSTCKSSSRNEALAQNDRMQLEAPINQHILVGMESSPLIKCDTWDDNSPSTTCDSSTKKVISKRPISEISDMIEELPGIQPAVSSTVGKEPSILRVHSLNAKQLFSCNEHIEAGSRWMKRLKINSVGSFGVGTKSSDVGEGSSHDKLSISDKIMNGNGENYDVKLQKRLGKEEMVIDHNVKSLRTEEKQRSMIFGSYGNQKWTQSCIASSPSNHEPLVICEPHSLKFRQEELPKKQFPSIAAMALVGKFMTGSLSCEFTKKGSVVVWNTKEH